jgi:hypothetical protein
VICLDCDPVPRDAVAVCALCGAGVCRDHAAVRPRHLVKAAAVMREVPIEPPARVVHCTTCQAAIDAGGHVATLRS